MSFGYQVLGFGGGGAVKILIDATGGTIEEIDDYRVHTFTSTGSFVVNDIAASLPAPAKAVDYVVVAGGGAGGYSWGAGGGAGGFRESHVDAISGTYTASPITSATSIPITASSYPITIGAGGGQTNSPPACGCQGTPGSVSTFSTISSSGGGGGGGGHQNPGLPGGSGGGAGGEPSGTPAGTGNVGGYSPAEGTPGGPGTRTAGGGGATVAGTGHPGGTGGAGAATQISLTAGIPGPDPLFQYYAGGGTPSQSPTNGGVGGGGGSPFNPGPTPESFGAVNSGGGSKGDVSNVPEAGGSGVVVIRYKYK